MRVSKIGLFCLFVFGVVVVFTTALPRIFASGSTWYVSPTGDDMGSGSELQPWKTIKKCVSTANPGDTCILRGGTYTESVDIKKSGSEGNPITIKNAQGERPVIDGQNMRATWTMTDANYWVIDGITIENSNSYGVYTIGSHNVTMKNCEVSYPLDGGLIFRNANAILVDSCNVHHTNWRGNGSNEAVSFMNITGFEIRNSSVHDSKEEGIDAKYGTSGGSIHHNRVYRNNGPNIYVDAASNIDIYANEVYEATGDKANVGLAVENNEKKYAVSNINIYNNILRSSPGGVSLWVEPGAESYAAFRNISVSNNVFYAHTGRGAIRVGSFDTYVVNSSIVNNIFWKNSSSIDAMGSSTVSNNLFDSGAKGAHSITTSDVRFVNESGNDFHVRADSPAIDAGIPTQSTVDFENNIRPIGTIDIGAYEYSGSKSPPAASPTPSSTPIPPSPSPSFTCPGDSSGKGTATMTVDLPTVGNYKLWVLMKGGGESANSLWVSLDTLYCVKVGDLSGMPSGAWTWVDYQDGSVANKIPALLLGKGKHTIRLIRNDKEPGVAIDRVLLTNNVSCVPTGNGDACLGIVSSPTAKPPTPTKRPLPTPTKGLSAISRSGVFTGAAENNGATSVRTKGKVSAGSNRFYLAALSTKPDVPIATVTGLGLSWRHLGSQCGGRSQTNVDLWWAYGSPKSDDYVTAQFEKSRSLRSAILTVLSYTGTSTSPVANMVRRNSNGLGDIRCSRGKDADRYSLFISNNSAKGLIIGVLGIRDAAHISGDGVKEITETHTSRGGGNDSGLAIVEMTPGTASTQTLSGVFTRKIDYAAAVFELLPQ